MKRDISEIISQKSSFIKEKAHILINILNNKLSSNNTVLEAITNIIISEKRLEDCEDIRELEMLVELNESLYKERKVKNQDDSDAYGVIFGVANYINDNVFNSETQKSLRDRLRLYMSTFNEERVYSSNYNKFVVITTTEPLQLLKKV